MRKQKSDLHLKRPAHLSPSRLLPHTRKSFFPTDFFESKHHSSNTKVRNKLPPLLPIEARAPQIHSKEAASVPLRYSKMRPAREFLYSGIKAEQ